MKRRQYSSFDTFIQGKKLKKSELLSKLNCAFRLFCLQGKISKILQTLIPPFFFQPCPFHFIQDLFAHFVKRSSIEGL